MRRPGEWIKKGLGGGMNGRVRWRLAGMMALIYAVQGSWWPLLAVHLEDLGISGRGRGWIFATLAIAAMATPLGAGQLADRLMPTQRLLSLVYAIGSGLLVLLATGPTARFDALFVLFLAYWLLTAPTYGLANSLAFRNLARPAEQFGGVRLWGTVGWMAVGWTVSGLMALHGSTRAGQGAYEAFWMAAAVSLGFSAYCLTLPNTPPLAQASRRVLDLRVIPELLSRPSVGVFLAAAFGVSLTTPFVYQTVPTYLQSLGLPRAGIALAMTLGQVLEIVALAALPVLLRRLGYARTLMLGVGAWALYYLNLAAHPPLWLALAGLPLNGVAIACFVVAGQMFLDSQAPADRRASSQAVHVVVTSGLGSALGNVLAGEITAWRGGVGAGLFLVPCAINAALLLVLAWRFRPVVAGEAPQGALAGPSPAPRGASLAAARLAPGTAEV
jgi:MFS family permease